jgi:putative IMPACT (imprinted ancient) family translation regulator
MALVAVTADHQRAGRLENDLRAAGHSVRDVAYGAAVTFHLGIPQAEAAAFRAWLADATSGTATCTEEGSAYVDVR